ncbi:MAG: DNA primase [Chitinophagales bacterium]
MIPEHTVAQILETAQIEEVVSDFINLKKRGANYIANCPFHNEKTPSFSISPSKGIFKCFGCGVAGNSAKFVMEHEKINYPEALRFLAKKYNIEVEEFNNEEVRAENMQREGLFIVNTFAQKHFSENLLEVEEGKTIGLSYFEERGFRKDTIEKFQLGYSVDSFDKFIKTAKAKGYNVDLLKKVGLILEKNNRKFSFFRGRVMFPIHNLSGKVIAFAGRTLRTDKKIPKYINSPETEIYNKSNVLYGIFFARNTIRKKDECFLVEGYTDVISLNQAGIENVVAASGTSLTIGQIRLIKRYTKNISILFDGDPAGIKAALRGIDLILKEEMNVKIILLPEGEDPDSYVKQQGRTGFEAYVKENSKDFIFFKTDLLLKEAQNDPIKRAEAVNDIIQTLSKIPDPIKRALYIRECSALLQISEKIIINATNKIKWRDITKEQMQQKQMPIEKKQKAENQRFIDKEIQQIHLAIEDENVAVKPQNFQKRIVTEEGLMRVLLEYGHKEIDIDVPVLAYIISEVEELPFQNKTYCKIVDYYKDHLEEGHLLTSDFFISHENDEISRTAVDLLCLPYQKSDNWEKMHNIFITEMVLRFKEEIEDLLNNYKLRHVMKLIDENLLHIKKVKSASDLTEHLETHKMLLDWKKSLSKILGIVILR